MALHAKWSKVARCARKARVADAIRLCEGHELVCQQTPQVEELLGRHVHSQGYCDVGITSWPSLRAKRTCLLCDPWSNVHAKVMIISQSQTSSSSKRGRFTTNAAVDCAAFLVLEVA